MKKYELNVGDLISFRFDLTGDIQRRLITISNGRYYVYDVDKCCFCHASDSLDGIVNKYSPFDDFKIYRRNDWNINVGGVSSCQN